MARTHYWNFLLDEEGRPIQNAEVWVYLAGTSTAAELYNSETGSFIAGPPATHTFTSYQGQTDSTQLI